MTGELGRNGELELELEEDAGDEGEGGDDDDKPPNAGGDIRKGPVVDILADGAEGDINGVETGWPLTELRIVLSKSCTGVGFELD